MEIIKYPVEAKWDALMERPAYDVAALFDKVRAVLEGVKTGGDNAVIRYGEQFDNVKVTSLQVSEAEIAEAENLLPVALKQAIGDAKEHIAAFHSAQRFKGLEVETTPGVVCRQQAVPIEKVGLYVPGGAAPLFSTVLMLAVPARIAGCREVTLCTPPDKEGKVPPAILFAARMAGVDKVFKAGGIQAIGAMAYGTESIPKAYKIFGPGNRYVTAAKQWVSLTGTAIDVPAGPSEVVVIADATANPLFVAADLLSQAEHGADSQALLLTACREMADKVLQAIETQQLHLPRKHFIAESLRHSRIVILRNNREIIDFTNRYAPEHLIIQTADYADIAEQITNAGSVFLGDYSPESAGDYASGANHTLPTNGYAKAYSGVHLDSFIRKITFQQITREGLRRLGDTLCAMADGEQMEAHRQAVTVRLHAL